MTDATDVNDSDDADNAGDQQGDAQPTPGQKVIGGAESTSEGEQPSPRVAITLSLRRDVLILSGLLAAALACSAFLGWRLYVNGSSADDARQALAAMQQASEERGHAEQLAMDYTKGAAELNYKDLPGWAQRLTANTTSELAAKLKEASKSMEQVIVPLQWDSTSTPITAKVRAEHDGIFVVNCFVSTITKNLQAVDGVQSTSTYTVTLNKNDNWIITDVGGIDAALKAVN
ncbi:hypothetical protein [Mycolicibacter minnesotensis]